eukprot:m.7147 g.7147  ORF g.7147 m.7147 type:complete len:194 (-) comp5105_c0_seq1:77-658(-)
MMGRQQVMAMVRRMTTVNSSMRLCAAARIANYSRTAVNMKPELISLRRLQSRSLFTNVSALMRTGHPSSLPFLPRMRATARCFSLQPPAIIEAAEKLNLLCEDVKLDMNPDELLKYQQMCNDFIERVAQERESLVEKQGLTDKDLEEMDKAVRTIQQQLKALIKLNRGRFSIGVWDSNEDTWQPDAKKPFWGE